jgi:nucleotide-binding universal stress UspA family protein
VALDGSDVSEQVLPHVHELASTFDSDVTLLTVPEGSESDQYVKRVTGYLEGICAGLGEKGVAARSLVIQSSPTQGILDAAKDRRADLIMMVTHGRGGVERQDKVKLGSVTEAILGAAPCPVFLVSAGSEVHWVSSGADSATLNA